MDRDVKTTIHPHLAATLQSFESSIDVVNSAVEIAGVFGLGGFKCTWQKPQMSEVAIGVGDCLRYRRKMPRLTGHFKDIVIESERMAGSCLFSESIELVFKSLVLCSEFVGPCI